MEDELLEAHYEEGAHRYGKRWDKTNIGWSSDTHSITSKVYGKRCIIFTTVLDKNGRPVHSEENYRR